MNWRTHHADRVDLQTAVVLYGPMQAMKWDAKLAKFPAIAQPKLDGAHMTASCQAQGAITLHSRAGMILTLPHLRDQLASMMMPGEAWDGQLYVHGRSFDEIMDMIRTADPALEFHVFDFIIYDHCVYRMQQLHARLPRSTVGPVRAVPVSFVHDADDVLHLFEIALEEGYEGIVVRDKYSAYRPGRAHPCLMKCKAAEDNEFTVKNFTLPGDGSVVFTCETKAGKTFRARMPDAGKAAVDIDAGALVTVRHNGWTVNGLPRQPRALRVRPAFDLPGGSA